jgi:hypothetical protein
MFQRMGEDGSQQAALLAQQISGHGSKNNENSNVTENSHSETVLPKIKPIPAEADLIPPKTYKAIVANKKLKEKVDTIGGITSGQDPIECGVDGRPVVFVTDQNFPAVLPSAEGRCLAIMRMEQASMDDLADLVIKLAKPVTISESTVFVVGSLSHLSRVGTHGYAISCVNIRRRLSGAFKGVKVVPFSPPPFGGCNGLELIRNMLDSCIWLAGTPGYPLSETQKVIVDMIMEDEGGGGLSILIGRFSSHTI